MYLAYEVSSRDETATLDVEMQPSCESVDIGIVMNGTCCYNYLTLDKEQLAHLIDQLKVFHSELK